MAKDPTDALRVAPGKKVSLKDHSTDATLGWHKEWAYRELEKVKLQLDVLQQRLYAEERRSVLLVLQAMDAAGKDGTIRSIASGLNPAGVNVTSFKTPGGPETAHDFLWRIHQVVPPKGHIGIFNRSHYEDVLVVRVKNLVPRQVWSKRYGHIADFERMLADEGTTVVKCYLHVSRETQRQRLQDRVEDPEKRWKFRLGDLDDRKLWPQYLRAYEAAIERTATTHAPWYVVPADRNWVRNLAVAKILLRTLQAMDPVIPEPEEGIVGVVVK
jgi:PPK2 family polyphosphate:nucleotide phosphotransferase